MADLLVVKLGGAALTDKAQYRALLPERVAELAAAVAAAWQSRPRRVALVHGAGSFGHADAARARLGDAPPLGERGVALGVAATRASLALLHAAVLDALVAAGAPAVSVPVTPHGDGFAGAALAALDAGLLPVLHGDVVYDAGSRRVRVLGGDAIACAVARAAAAAGAAAVRLVFVTGVDGVFTAPPRSPGAALLTRVDVALSNSACGDVKLVKLVIDAAEPAAGGAEQLQLDAPAGADVTGGIRAKLDAVAAVVAGTGGVRVASIVGAMSSDVLVRCLALDTPLDELLRVRGTHVVPAPSQSAAGDVQAGTGEAVHA